MEKDKVKAKGKIVIFIVIGIIVIAGVVVLYIFLGNSGKGPEKSEIEIKRIGVEEGANLDMPYEYIRSMMNRQESLLKNAVDIEAQTIIAKRPENILLAYPKPWHVAPVDRLLYVQGITSIRAIERKGNCEVTFIDGYDSSYLMMKNDGDVKGYAILPEWMKEGIAPGYKVDDITIKLINEEPRHWSTYFKVIGFYKADTEDTIYASMYSFAELYKFEEDVLNNLITTHSIYYMEGADMTSLYSFMNDYYTDTQK